MKKIITAILAAAALAACKPETYTGPLDSPVGNWDGVKAEYYFDGEMVGEAEVCQYSAISFYKDGLCCIEGVKGTFPYTYDNGSLILTVDNVTWAVSQLTGTQMVLQYLETTYPEDYEHTNNLELPIEYKGFTINADKYGYYYEVNQGDRVYCNYFGTTDKAGALVIDFWYDTHTDYFIPLVVEVKK
jgi:hypothetical protein